MLCTFTDSSVGVARYKSQSVVRPLTYYFRLFPLLPVLLSFACRHLACLILEGVAGYAERIRQAMCSTTKQNLHRL